MAHIHQSIEGLPEGYDTAVGERGATLSAGERQRVSIARAFLKDPPILIFDEPTSALDPDTEHRVKESLRELARNRTTFIISHRMSLLDVATRVFVLDQGRLRERVCAEALAPAG
jgi:ABC-type multidrug transport system fused ATPase/permease subunit